MVKGLGDCIVKQMSAYRTKKVKVYIGVSQKPLEESADWETHNGRWCVYGVYEDPDEVAGKLMDLSLTHYVWDWKVYETKGVYGKKWLSIDLVLAPSKNCKTNIDADLIEGIITRMEK